MMANTRVNTPTPCQIGKHPLAPGSSPADLQGARGRAVADCDGDGELRNKPTNPPMPCLWKAPASAQKTKKQNQADYSLERAVGGRRGGGGGRRRSEWQ